MAECFYEDVGILELSCLWRCTACGYEKANFDKIGGWHYCPGCGAKISEWRK